MFIFREKFEQLIELKKKKTVHFDSEMAFNNIFLAETWIVTKSIN